MRSRFVTAVMHLNCVTARAPLQHIAITSTRAYCVMCKPALWGPGRERVGRGARLGRGGFDPNAPARFSRLLEGACTRHSQQERFCMVFR